MAKRLNKEKVKEVLLPPKVKPVVKDLERQAPIVPSQRRRGSLEGLFASLQDRETTLWG